MSLTTEDTEDTGWKTISEEMERQRDEAIAVADELSEIAGATLGWYLAQKDPDNATIQKIICAIQKWKELRK